MAEHKTLPFSKLHKAKLNSGLAASRPSVPEGVGDVYFSTDTAILNIADTAGTAWVQYDLDLGTIVLDDLTDVDVSAPSTNHVLFFNGTIWTSGVLPTEQLTLTGLSDVTITSAAKGNILARTTTTWENVAVGSNNTVLTANSAFSRGVTWAAPIDEDARRLALIGL